MSAAVFIVERHWDRKGHGGHSRETDYDIYLNRIRLRGFSTHGDMQEGYWGNRAQPMADEYAANVASAIGAKVYRAKAINQHL